MRNGDALIVVDVQQDFLRGGSLPIDTGSEVVPRVNAYVTAFDVRNLPVFLTRDWHPYNHCSFKSAGGRWPSHCVRGTPGANWPDELWVPPAARVVSKGTGKDIEAFSGFSGTSLLALLRELEVERLFICGLATDHCVHDTVMDARTHGFEVIVLADAIRAVNAKPGDETRAIRKMLECGAQLFQPSGTGGLTAQGSAEDSAPACRYGFGRTVALPLTDAIARVTEALKVEGFGVLTDTDFAATLKAKLGADIPPYRILGACNPALAYRGLQAEPSLGLLLPCNVVVREDSARVVHVEFLDPDVLAALSNNQPVIQMAGEVREKLLRVMAAI